MLESTFKRKFLIKLETLYPGIIILQNDPEFRPGIPDTILLHGDRWAMLEFKRSSTARRQPNQDYYVDVLDKMSYAAFVCPENERTILNDLQSALQPQR